VVVVYSKTENRIKILDKNVIPDSQIAYFPFLLYTKEQLMNFIEKE